MKRLTPIILVIAAVALIPAALMFERLSPETWRQRLSVPVLNLEVSRHTPLHSEGIFLPPRITRNLTLTAADNPVILPSRTEVPAGVTLTLEPGVTVFAHEFAELSVSGTLRMQGAEADPITFTSNERHPQNQVWNGIILEEGSRADITQTHIQYASPAVTCLGGSQATVTDSEITQTLIGIFRESPNCAVERTRIEAIHDSIISTL